MGPIPAVDSTLSSKLVKKSFMAHTAAMKLETVIKHFGSVKAMAKALDIYPQAIYQWKDGGIPLLRQYQIQKMTKNKFVVNERQP